MTRRPDWRVFLICLALAAGAAGRLWASGAPALHAAAPRAITILEAPSPEFTFGQSMVFRLAARSSAAITRASLHSLAGAGPARKLGEAAFEPAETISASLQLDLSLSPLPPFTPVAFWWELEDAAGDQLTGERQTFFYEDNRFDWQRSTAGALTVHWYRGDQAFGQAALDTATAALARASRDIRGPLPERLDLYLYASESEIQAALTRVGRTWADGHADPELGVVFVAVAPGLSAEFALDREIAHELTHVLIYRVTGSSFDRVPAWLNEGLAVANQAQPDAAFPARLNRARDQGALLSFEQLCGPFPADPDLAALAYSQSDSLVRYIRSKFGSEGIDALVSAYASGAACNDGVQQALGLPLAALEAQWRREVIFPSQVGPRWQALAPWVLLAGVVLAAPLLFLALTMPRRPRAQNRML